MADTSLAVRIHVAWWLRLYLQALVMWCTLTNMAPNDERVLYCVMKGLSVRTEPKQRTLRAQLRSMLQKRQSPPLRSSGLK